MDRLSKARLTRLLIGALLRISSALELVEEHGELQWLRSLLRDIEKRLDEAINRLEREERKVVVKL